MGKRLLFASSALASLDDTVFGYSQGIIAAVQVQPQFIERMYHKTVTLERIQAGNAGVDPFVQGLSFLPSTVQKITIYIFCFSYSGLMP